MMTPFHLLATSAAWSLHRSRTALTEAAHRAAAAARDAAADRGTLQAWRPSVGRTGGHSDPLAVAVVDRPAVGPDRYSRLATSTTNTLQWLADMLQPPTPEGWDPLERIQARLPWTTPAAAGELARWLQEADQRIRDALDMPPDQAPLSGVPCPHCGQRQLVVQTAGPDPAAWTVVCATGRLCSGTGCPCGMPGAVEGVAHIWPRSVVLGAVAGAASR